MNRSTLKTDRNLDKKPYEPFLPECFFSLKKNENILITGSTGIGKSYIASATRQPGLVCSDLRFSMPSSSKLFAMLKMARADGSYIKEIARIEKMDLLILDDFWACSLWIIINRSALIEIIEDRHGKRSTIITAQLPVESVARCNR